MKPVLSFAFALFLATVAAGIARGQLVNSEWNTGNGDWNVATNWFPNDVPDNGGGLTYAVQIGNRPVAAGAQVTFVPEDGTSDSIDSLVISSAQTCSPTATRFLSSGKQPLMASVRQFASILTPRRGLLASTPTISTSMVAAHRHDWRHSQRRYPDGNQRRKRALGIWPGQCRRFRRGRGDGF